MAEPIVWGPIAWRANFSLAKRVDLEIASNSDTRHTVEHAQLLFTVQSFLFPCDICCAFAIEYVNACPAPRYLFVDWLYDMKACIEAKIKTVQYHKHKVEECIPPHLSRSSMYERLASEDALVEQERRLDWYRFILLASLVAETHNQRELKRMAMAQLVQLFGTIFELTLDESDPSTHESVVKQLNLWGAPVVAIESWAKSLVE